MLSMLKPWKKKRQHKKQRKYSSRKPSILQTKKECFLTGATDRLHAHHIYFGSDRNKSDKNGFWVWLRWDRHIADSPHRTPHNDREVDMYLKRLCQAKYEETHSRKEFTDLMGRNYLDGDYEEE